MQLPISFQNAVVVAFEQGIRYLWIDSLCIVQDDHADWTWHAQNIYALNIGLTRAPNSQSGSFGRRWLDKPRGKPIKTMEINISHDATKYVIYGRIPLTIAHKSFCTRMNRSYFDSMDEDYKLMLGLAPMLNRGWVFQERFLATRMVHFHTSEMVWECKSTTKCECSGLDKNSRKHAITKILRPLRAGSSVNSLERFMSVWRGVIFEYSKLKLSKASDRFPALTGLARRFQLITGLKCWRDSLQTLTQPW